MKVHTRLWMRPNQTSDIWVHRQLMGGDHLPQRVQVLRRDLCKMSKGTMEVKKQKIVKARFANHVRSVTRLCEAHWCVVDRSLHKSRLAWNVIEMRDE